MAKFNLIGGHPALDLVNTYDNRFRPGSEKELLSTYDDLLRFTAESGLLDKSEERLLRAHRGDRDRAAALRSAHELREGLSAVLYASLDGHAPAAEALAVLERQFKNAAKHRELKWNASGGVWAWPKPSINAALPVWKVADAAAEFLVSAAAGRVHSCEAIPCRWLFLDNSKNHTRRWCDMKLCGNRMKARRHQATLAAREES